MTGWGFYGRQQELEQLAEILNRGRWFFVKISGRRRIGKTSLIHEALRPQDTSRIVYVQIPDSDPAGVISTVRDFYSTFGVAENAPTDLRSFAGSISDLVRRGFTVALDEFQYFHRKALYEFNSHLQYEVDRLTSDASAVHGGLFVLGSIHTEMAALLEDRSAPLFNRITDQLEVPHLDIASVLAILRSHANDEPERLLFLWNLFEGVPKFYRDCYEQDALGADRRTLLRRMFFSSSSPLRTEADNWFLRELRGRYDLVLKYVARKPGCTNADLDAHIRSVDPNSERQAGGYIQVLQNRYKMIDRLQPMFAKPSSRSGRYYLRDNFLRSWLSALATTTAAINFRPLDPLLDEADARLEEAEGHGLEQLVGTLYEERSRKGIGDFGLTARVQGYWDRHGTELDLVALNSDTKTVRLGSCKRNASKLIGDLAAFDRHVDRFLKVTRQFEGWKTEKVAIAARHTPDSRRLAQERGYIAQDLVDLTRDL